MRRESATQASENASPVHLLLDFFFAKHKEYSYYLELYLQLDMSSLLNMAIAEIANCLFYSTTKGFRFYSTRGVDGIS